MMILGKSTVVWLFLMVFSISSAADEDRQLPEWFDGNRVQAHTRLILPWWGDKPIFYKAAEGFQEMGANVFTRFTKGGNDACWWPSKIGAVRPEAEKFNFVQKMIDNAHSRGMRMIGYYRHMADKAMAEKHPEWLCRKWDGSSIKEAGKRPDWLCLNTGFRDFIKARLLEQVDMGLDGFYFDYIHMPGSWLGTPTYMYICSCQTCREKFEKTYGQKMPEKPKMGDSDGKLLIDFYNRTITEIFKEWTKAVHQRNPDCVMIISCTFTASMYSSIMPSSFAAVVDSAKTEWNKAVVWPREIPEGILKPDDDMRWAAGFTYLRGACGDRPPHSWINNLWTKEEALSASAACITYGLIANLCTNEDEIPKMAFKPAFDLGNKVSPWLMRTRPMRWAAIHFNEAWAGHFWPDNENIWENVL
ncbi:MAG: alpha-amylase family protein, partial [Planctomycetota bacterium]